MNKRRSLTPMDTPATGPHAMRRGGARRQVTERVTLADGDVKHDGWALNASDGGLRAILDEREDKVRLELGKQYDVTLGDPDSGAPGATKRRGRIVWLQEEPDGFVVGIEYKFE